MNMQTRMNHRLLLAAIVAGAASWERVTHRRGVLRVGESKYETCLDQHGCPILNELAIRSITNEMQRPVRSRNPVAEPRIAPAKHSDFTVRRGDAKAKGLRNAHQVPSRPLFDAAGSGTVITD